MSASQSLRFGTLLLALGALGAGCGSDDEGDAPEITDLVVTPTTVGVGMAQAITATISFSDADGDLASAGVAVAPEGGEETALEPAAVEGAEGTTAGQFQLGISLQLPAAGSYEMRFWLEDEAGNKSKRRTATITAQ